MIECISCGLALTRRKIVYGEGVKGEIMIIGEAPGYYEDKIGSPFVGVAGKHLDSYLKYFGFSRDKNIYITNIVKCRPPNNDTPTVQEAVTCSNLWLSKEIIDVNPLILVILGNVALRTIFNNFNLNISTIHGVWYGKNNNIIATYHPSYSLRNLDFEIEGKRFNKAMFEDFKKVYLQYKYLKS